MTRKFEWISLSAAVARMSELHPIYRSLVGLARRDLENIIRVGRAKLHGCSPDALHEPPEEISEISSRHRLDLIHNAVYERRPGTGGDKVLFRYVEIEWTSAARYFKGEPEEVEESAAEVVVTTSGKKERGPLPKKLEATTETMRARIRDGSLTIDGLGKMLEKNMAETFGVSRDTCRKARRTVLSDREFIEKYSRQTPTNSNK
jgi:hypothetical protein